MAFRDIMGKITSTWEILKYWPCTYNPRENGRLMGFSMLTKDKHISFPADFSNARFISEGSY